MKLKKIERIFSEQLKFIKPPEETLRKINKLADEYCNFINEKLKNNSINAEVFIGGSLAKGTLIKKETYDIDIFVRFDGYKSEELEELLKKILGERFKRVHGSRDYFQLKIDEILIEIIPVLKISTPDKAQNVTDLSYFHVNYLISKIKENSKLKDQIILAKNFCYAQKVYGAESYIKGFSGYALELLLCHYKTFLQFMLEIVSLKENEKLIIDDADFYNNDEELLKQINIAKRQSPIILIDPTFKERNALSGLSEETFIRFKKVCKQFLKKPSRNFFILKLVSEQFRKLKDVKVISVVTDKQSGDIAGTKSKKFFNFFSRKLKEEFTIKKSAFDYSEKENKAYFYFKLDKKDDEIVKGPEINDKKNFIKFKKIHPRAFTKDNYIYAKIIHDKNFYEWYLLFKKKNRKSIREMGIKEIRNTLSET